VLPHRRISAGDMAQPTQQELAAANLELVTAMCLLEVCV
jgi:hypothetical protein